MAVSRQRIVDHVSPECPSRSCGPAIRFRTHIAVRILTGAVALPRRTGQRLATHRTGDVGKHGSGDDDPGAHERGEKKPSLSQIAWVEISKSLIEPTAPSSKGLGYRLERLDGDDDLDHAAPRFDRHAGLRSLPDAAPVPATG